MKSKPSVARLSLQSRRRWAQRFKDNRLGRAWFHGLFKKQGGLCDYCGIKMHKRRRLMDNDRATFDHVKPISRGGFVDDIFNVVLACYRCNKDKGDLTGDEFRAFVREHGRHPDASERLAMAQAGGYALPGSTAIPVWRAA